MPEKKKKKWFRALLRHRLFVMLLLLLQIVLIIVFLVDRSLTSEFFGYALSIFSIIVALYIIANQDRPAYKLTWVFLILTFPIFGGLFYLLFRGQTHSKSLRTQMKKITDAALPAFSMAPDKTAAACEALPAEEREIRYLADVGGFPVYGETKTDYLSSGEAYLASLLRDLERAEKYIFLEFFIIEDGEMWESVHTILKKKAAAGVEVRLIYDDVGCFLRLPRDFVKVLAKEGIRCIRFNPLSAFLIATHNNRDHRKLVSVDGRIAYMSGLNLADEYINKISPFGHWKDNGIRLEGPASWSATMIFLQMWTLAENKAEDFTSYYPERAYFDTPTDAIGFVQPYADTPFDEENVSEHVYMHMIAKAKRSVYVMTPYLIIENSMVAELCLAAKSGVDVRIITPHRWDKRMVHFTTRSYYRELITAGVKIYEYTPGFIHAKTIVCDGEIATIGSANMDFRSLYLQFECGVRMYGTTAVTSIEKDFLETQEKSHPITEKDCKANPLVRFVQDICRLFAPLM
ncbi:MAG: cardiolipin synthase [Clostridia bacterium]|nr:cardiolipin synthase [Clostridia bacterium]